MASRFPVFNSKNVPKSVRVQIALAVIAVAAIAVVHVALQTGFVSLGSGASAERARAEPPTQEPVSIAAEPARRDLKRGDAASR